MNWISYADLIHDIPRYSAKLPRDLIGVVGIPRSGMMVATMIAIHRGIHLSDANHFISTGQFYPPGARMRTRPPASGKVLIVDDSSRGGTSFRPILERIANKQYCGQNMLDDYTILTGCMYGTSEAIQNLDHVYKLVRCKRIFEWNLFSHKRIGKCMLDLDGVICEDITIDENRFLKVFT